ncbi:MAG: NAD(P)H-dependent oxidoreductase [Flavobacteriales bacterium]|nr:NAD(P)H-dependent oxidoreductase [Flavobacteriales bacterium]
MEYIEALKWRYATKKFDPNKSVPNDTLKRILEAGSLTATSLGLQAIKIIRVESPEIRKALLPHCYNQHQIVDASDLLIICAHISVGEEHINEYIERIAKTRNQNISDLNGFKNMISNFVDGFDSLEPMQEWLARQTYITLGTLLTACALEQIDSCPMEGFKPKEISEVLDLESLGLYPTLLLPIGYRSEEDKNQHLIKVRKPITDFVSNI